MRLLFVADGRSPTALNWIRYFTENASPADEVFLASTFQSQPDLKLSGYEFIPVAFSSAKNTQQPGNPEVRRGNQPTKKSRGLWGASTLKLRTAIRQWLGPFTIPRASRQLRGMIERVQPDLVHAMRIPYEGMLAAEAGGIVPLLISVWGNDFTLHAPSTPFMAHYTEWALKIADGLHADCQRDIRLAQKLGFSSSKPTLVIPGSGGIRSDIFYPPQQPASNPEVRRGNPIVINPRGFRAYVCNEAFFQAIPLVLKHIPDALFICPGMAAEPQVLAWVNSLKINASVRLLPIATQPELAALLRSAQVMVSPTTHDGTPNSLLEAMACGCLPVAGDLDSIREWITPAENGLLVQPTDPQSIANGIIQALKDPALRQKAATQNAAILAERADYARSMQRALDFYKQLTSSTT